MPDTPDPAELDRLAEAISREWRQQTPGVLGPATRAVLARDAARVALWQQAERIAQLTNERGTAWKLYRAEQNDHIATRASADAEHERAEKLQRIVDGYDRTPAEQRAADAESELADVRARLGNVRELHHSIAGPCVHCEYWWPCPTIRVIDGGDQA